MTFSIIFTRSIQFNYNLPLKYTILCVNLQIILAFALIDIYDS